MSLLDRMAERRGEQRGTDVAPLIASYQASTPMAYTSQGVLPDTSNLAAWMQAQMDSSGGLLIAKG